MAPVCYICTRMGQVQKRVQKSGTRLWVLEYRPANLPVRWAESREEIPEFDWTKGTSPFSASWDRAFVLRDSPEWGAVGLPRLVRSDIRESGSHRLEASVTITLSRLWPHAIKKGAEEAESPFRKAVQRAVERIGLLDPWGDERQTRVFLDTHLLPIGDVLASWFYAALFGWFWQQLLQRTEAMPFPATVVEMDRLRSGLETELPETTFAFNFSEGFSNLFDYGPGFWTTEAPSREAWLAKMSSHFHHKARQALGFRIIPNPSEGALYARVGALDWAWYELGELYAPASGTRNCANPRCRHMFIPGAFGGGYKYCSKTCQNTKNMNDKRVRAKGDGTASKKTVP